MLAAFGISVICLAPLRAEPGDSPSSAPSASASKHPKGWRGWTLPKTKPGTLELISVTDDWSVAIRRVGMRSKEARFDDLGEVTVCPVVLSPTGELYYGFVRQYPAGSIGRRWLYWDFPTQFRAPNARARTEQEADFGDHLLDSLILDTAPEKKVIPSGLYQLKWLVNDQLIDNGDKFHYAFHKTEADR